MNESIRKAIEEKIKELEWRNQVRSLEIIDWLKGLLKETEAKPEPIKKEVKVELPEEKKEAPKRKIIFKKK